MHVGRRARRGAGPQMGQRLGGLAGAQQRQAELELRRRIAGSASSALRSSAMARSWSPLAALTVASRRSAAELEPLRLQRRRVGLQPLVDLELARALVGRGRAAGATWPARSALPCAPDRARWRGVPRRPPPRTAPAAAAPAPARRASRPAAGRSSRAAVNSASASVSRPTTEVHLGQLVVRGGVVRARARSAARTRRWRRRSPAASAAARRASERRC